MDAIEQAKHTARVFLTECRSRRHGHGWEFVFRGAQNARRRAASVPAIPARPAPAHTPQMELFA